MLGDLLGEELELPVFLYGELAGGRTRAELRRGGPAGLAERIETGELRPDFGPPPASSDRRRGARGRAAAAGRVQRRAGAAGDARGRRAIAAGIREGGAEGCPGCARSGCGSSTASVAQVSINVEDHRRTPLAAVVAAVGRHATPARAELVGLAPAAAFDGLPGRPPGRADLPADRGTLSPPRRRPAHTKLRSTMAQTKRKRRTKHRGTAAGTIEARGRTGRPPTAEERKKQARMSARERRLNTPPTWKRSLKRAAFAAAIMSSSW